jgi:quercetin dioxygenase-like cupin family protein
MDRLYKSADFFRPTEGAPTRLVIASSAEAAIVAWSVQPGQEIRAHVHPHGQDTWTVLSGQGDYYLDAAGAKARIVTGDVVVAQAGCLHGVFNNGDEPLHFISVVSPSEAGYEAVVTD